MTKRKGFPLPAFDSLKDLKPKETVSDSVNFLGDFNLPEYAKGGHSLMTTPKVM